MRCLILIIALCLAAQDVIAAEYLAQFTVNGKRVGNFVVYDRDGTTYLEAAAFRALKLPVTEDVPVSKLAWYGEFTWNQAEQQLVLKTNKISIFGEGAKLPELGVDLPAVSSKRFDIKSLDYQAYASFGSYKPSQNYFLSGTGRAFGLDIDAAFYSNQRAGGTINWHDEKNEYVRDVKLGEIQVSGVDRGVSITNESSTRYQSSFGSEQVVVEYPIGTKIDLYQGTETYIGSVTVDSPNYIVNLPLSYGSSSYLLRAFLMTGEIREKTISRTVDSYMTETGKLTYNLSGGFNRLDQMTHQSRAAYGISNRLTLTADTSSTKLSGLQANGGIYYTPIDGWVLSGKGGNRGYTATSYFNNSKLGALSLSYNNYLVSTFTGILAPRLPLSPVLTVTNSNYLGTNTTSGTLRAGVNLGKFYLSPRLEYSEVKSNDSLQQTRSAGLQVMASLPHEFTLRADSLYTNNTVGDLTTLDIDLEKRFSFGSVSSKMRMSNLAGQFRLDDTSLNLQLYNFKYASLSAEYRHSWSSHADIATLSISGSLTKVGAVSSPQTHSATVQIRTYLDNSNCGKYVDGVDTLIPANMRFDNRAVTNTGEYINHNLTPYIPYLIEVEPEVDSEPAAPTYKVIPARGEIATVDIPFKLVKTLDGRVLSGKSNEMITLKLKDSSIKKVYSGYEGFWSTRIREDLTPVSVVPAESEIAKLVTSESSIITISGRVLSGKSNELVELKLRDGSIEKIYTSNDGYFNLKIREDLTPVIVIPQHIES